MHRGSCLCGAVRFETAAALHPPDACHCSQCRKQSGHYWVSTEVPLSALTIVGDEKVTWFRSSERVQRGFCSTCGSFLFWQPIGQDRMGIAMGAFDGTTGIRLEKHIFTRDKGDYYDIADGLPQE